MLSRERLGIPVAQQAVRRMCEGIRRDPVPGASASVKGYAQSAAFAWDKFALRDLRRAWRAKLAPQAFTSRIS